MWTSSWRDASSPPRARYRTPNCSRGAATWQPITPPPLPSPSFPCLWVRDRQSKPSSFCINKKKNIHSFILISCLGNDFQSQTKLHTLLQFAFLVWLDPWLTTASLFCYFISIIVPNFRLETKKERLKPNYCNFTQITHRLFCVTSFW